MALDLIIGGILGAGAGLALWKALQGKPKKISNPKFRVGDIVTMTGGGAGDTSTYRITAAHFFQDEWRYDYAVKDDPNKTYAQGANAPESRFHLLEPAGG